MLTIIHEMNHFIRRMSVPNKTILSCKTPQKDQNDGGQLMFKHIFGVDCISLIGNNMSDILLNVNNWSISKEDLKKKLEMTEKQNQNCVIQTMKNKNNTETQWHCISMAEQIDLKELSKSIDNQKH